MRDDSAPVAGPYLDFFGFKERPFTLLPDPNCLFWSSQHERAFAVLEYGMVAGGPITLLTGEIGTGKTTLLQALIAAMEDDVTVGLISHAQGGRGELLQWILNALGVGFDARASSIQLFQLLQNFLVDEYAAGRQVIVILDEAQNLSMEGLEELRLLTNMNSGRDVLIQLILTGQPELRDMVLAPSMRQLAQRVAASFHLQAMTQGTVADYIRHRLRHAGGSGAEFTPEACALIHTHAGGVPRLVNQLAEFALFYAWSADSGAVDADRVTEVLKDGVFFAGPPVADIPVVQFRKNRVQNG